MRVEIRPAADSDVRAAIDGALPAGELRLGDGGVRVGAAKPLDADALRAAAALAARSLRGAGGSVAWRLDGALPLAPEEQVRALVEGSAFGAYDLGLFKRGYAERPELQLALDAPPELEPLARRQETVARHVAAARDLANRPPNDLTPTALARAARAHADGRVAVESFGRDWIEERGMGAFAGVARSSAEEPQLIVMRYDPPDARDGLTLGLVGKAVTFDSGGISLKQPLRMQDMKGDMAGGAAAVEGLAAIASLGLPIRAVAVVAATENLQGGNAFKPGDILRAASGKTIEIINTDAEGRLLLADALHHARELGATHVIDLATLTGAMTLALGDLIAGWFANDEDWAARVEDATRASGDLGCRFPLHRRYRRYIDSNFADLKNASELREGGPVLAAMFLQEFAGDGPWAHVDMAGPGYVRRRRPDYILDEGGTGYGVRLIVELAQGLAS
ncbi:MAG TPA: leucyl aminopeptidase family protein [Gaiellaceae bacterium]|nr:leucyl aminopeptidase family protein [Gaiellaceae bacterium]